MNLRPSGPKPDALPGCATPRLVNFLTYKGYLRNEKEARGNIDSYLSIYDLVKKLTASTGKSHLITGVKDSYFGHNSSKPKNFGLKSIYSDCYLPNEN